MVVRALVNCVLSPVCLRSPFPGPFGDLRFDISLTKIFEMTAWGIKLEMKHRAEEYPGEQARQAVYEICIYWCSI